MRERDSSAKNSLPEIPKGELPAQTPRATAVAEANKALASMVNYESQYTRNTSDIQKRIFAFSDFIEREVKTLAAERAS